MLDNYIKWNFEPVYKIDSGYEDIWEQLETYTKDQYDSLNEEGQAALIEEVFQIYRTRNIFPITYYNEEGIKEEIIKCREKEYKEFDGITLDQRPTQGTGLLKFLFLVKLTFPLFIKLDILFFIIFHFFK